jgi:transposase
MPPKKQYARAQLKKEAREVAELLPIADTDNSERRRRAALSDVASEIDAESSATSDCDEVNDASDESCSDDEIEICEGLRSKNDDTFMAAVRHIHNESLNLPTAPAPRSNPKVPVKRPTSAPAATAPAAKAPAAKAPAAKAPAVKSTALGALLQQRSEHHECDVPADAVLDITQKFALVNELLHSLIQKADERDADALKHVRTLVRNVYVHCGMRGGKSIESEHAAAQATVVSLQTEKKRLEAELYKYSDTIAEVFAKQQLAMQARDEFAQRQEKELKELKLHNAELLRRLNSLKEPKLRSTPSRSVPASRSVSPLEAVPVPPHILMPQSPPARRARSSATEVATPCARRTLDFLPASPEEAQPRYGCPFCPYRCNGVTTLDRHVKACNDRPGKKPGRPSSGHAPHRDLAAKHNGLGDSMNAAIAQYHETIADGSGSRIRKDAETLERQSVWKGDAELAREILNKVRLRAPRPPPIAVPPPRIPGPVTRREALAISYLFGLGMTIRVIADAFGLSETWVRTLGKDPDFVLRSSELKRSRGDLVEVYPGVVIILRVFFEANPTGHLKELYGRLKGKIKISYNTLWRIAKLLYSNLAPIIRPLHSTAQTVKRVEFATNLLAEIQAHHSTLIRDIFWSDEKKFVFVKTASRPRVWVPLEQKASPDQAPCASHSERPTELDSEDVPADAATGETDDAAAPAPAPAPQPARNMRIIYRPHGKSDGVMVWMAVNLELGHTHIHFLPKHKTIDAAYHQTTLETCFVPFAKKFALETGRTAILMQDNATVHKADSLNGFYAKMAEAPAREGGFKLLNNWPPLSPDLNPIENVWAWLEKRRPLQFTGGLTQFKEWIVTELDSEAGRKQVAAVCESIIDRCTAVIEAGGRATKY